MGEGRQALDMDSEQARERVSLGVTELWELGCDVLHWAVPLAQLHSGQGRSLSHGPGGCGVTLGAQCVCQYVRPRSNVPPSRRQLGGVLPLELSNAFTGKLADGILTCVLSQETQCRGGHIVVVAVHADVSGLGQDVGAGRASPTATAGAGGLMFQDRTLLDEQVEVTTNRSRRQPKTAGEGGGCQWAILGDRLSDPVTGARLENVRSGVGSLRTLGNGTIGDKHKNSVT